MSITPTYCSNYLYQSLLLVHLIYITTYCTYYRSLYYRLLCQEEWLFPKALQANKILWIYTHETLHSLTKWLLVKQNPQNSTSNSPNSFISFSKDLPTYPVSCKLSLSSFFNQSLAQLPVTAEPECVKDFSIRSWVQHSVSRLSFRVGRLSPHQLSLFSVSLSIGRSPHRSPFESVP